MIQSMEILQLPLLALQEKIEQELTANPVLEQVEPEAESEETPSDNDSGLEERKDIVVKEDNDKVEDFRRLDNMDIVMRNTIIVPSLSTCGVIVANRIKNLKPWPIPRPALNHSMNF